MKSDVIIDTQDHITEEAVANSATNLVQAQSILVVARSGILQHTLPVAVSGREVSINQDIKAVQPLGNIRSDYLALALKAFEKEILHACTKTGTTVQSLEMPAFLSFTIPVAPLAVQDRITAEVQKQFTRLEVGVTALRRVQANLKRSRAAVLKAACEGRLVPTEAEIARAEGRPFESGQQLLARILTERRQNWQGRGKYKEPEIPDIEALPELPLGWTYATVEQLGIVGEQAVLTGPFGTNLTSADFTDAGVPVLTISCLKDTGIKMEKADFVSEEKAVELGRYRLAPGDLLFSRMASVGRAGIAGESLRGALFNYHIMRLRLEPSVLLAKFYLAYVRGASQVEQYLKEANHGATRAGINTEQLLHMPVALPPIAEQTRIVAEVERRLSMVEEVQAVVTTNLQRATRLRRSILKSAFSGKLTPKYTSDGHSADEFERVFRAHEELKAVQATKRKPKVRRINAQRQDMKTPLDIALALEAALTKAEPSATVLDVFDDLGCSPAQVYEFYDAIADSPIAVTRLGGASRVRKSRRSSKTKKIRTEAPFRLCELHVKKFKNLEDYEIRFRPEHALDVVLGWNGTGKSNLFEVLIIIFRDLHDWQAKDKWTPDEGLHGYRIVYQVGKRVVKVDWDGQSRRPEAFVGRDIDSLIRCARDMLPLPQFVFGYYSGPSNRFADLFVEPKQDHYNRLLAQNTDDEKTLALLLQQRRFFNAETRHAKYALLSFFHDEDPAVTRFLKCHLRIVNLESVLFVLKRPRWARNNKPEDFWGASGLLRPVLERLRKHSIGHMVLRQTVDVGYAEEKQDHYYMLLPNKQHFQALAAEYGAPTSLFVALESLDFSSIIHEVRIRVRINATAAKQCVITFKEMSEGEQQLLMVLGLLRFTQTSQSLVLLDEPDTHLNPHWQLGYLHLLLEALLGPKTKSSSGERISIEELEKKLTSQVLLSTHDPLAVASLLKENIHLLKRKEGTEECVAVSPSDDPRGMGFTGILTSEMFGLKSDLDGETMRLLDTQAVLAGKEKLTAAERKTLSDLTDEVDRLGFKTTSSDPYYRNYLQGLMRRAASRRIVQKQSWTSADIEVLRKETDSILEEIEREEARK